MAKEKFNWKGLFINDEENSLESIPEKSEPTIRSSSNSNSFPETKNKVSKFPDHIPQVSTVDNNVLSTIIEMYESGFESLNQPGYDFYEFFKAVKAVNSHEPAIYKMALTMAQGVDKKVTKSTLLTQADFYIAEIEKVHQQYETQGNSKKTQIQHTQKTKKESLSSEIASLEKKLMEIQNQISEKKNELHSIDANLITEVAEIDQKILANNKAKAKILETIMTVVDGIRKNT